MQHWKSCSPSRFCKALKFLGVIFSHLALSIQGFRWIVTMKKEANLAFKLFLKILWIKPPFHLKNDANYVYFHIFPLAEVCYSGLETLKVTRWTHSFPLFWSEDAITKPVFIDLISQANCNTLRAEKRKILHNAAGKNYFKWLLFNF